VPTVLRVGNFRISIMIRDEHEPPHVHVEHPDGKIVVLLDEISRQARVIRATRRLKSHDIGTIEDLIDCHFIELLAAWETIHR
jgi:hypothetical protein